MTHPDVIYARMLPRPVPRVARMIRYALSAGLSVEYVGAHREAGLADREIIDDVPVVRIGPYLPSLNGRGFLRYVTGVLRFNLAFLRVLLSRRPRVVHYSDLETVPAALVYRLLSGARSIYNIHDNYAERYAVGRGPRAILNAVEGVAVLLSTVALVPEPFRRDALPRWCRSKILVVRNAPEPLDAAPAHGDFGSRPIRVAYAGWLDDGRGIHELVELANSCRGRIEVRIAGEGSADLVELIEGSAAEYLGSLTHAATLDLFRQSDFVAAIYGPSRPINRMAAPNKLAEALALGRPIVTNTEVLMTAGDDFDECSIRVPYARLSELPQRLEDVGSDGPARYAEMCAAARSTYEALYSWDEQRKAMAQVYHKVGLT